MNTTKYLVTDDGLEVGTFGAEEVYGMLARGDLSRKALVRQEGGEEWKPAAALVPPRPVAAQGGVVGYGGHWRVMAMVCLVAAGVGLFGGAVCGVPWLAGAAGGLVPLAVMLYVVDRLEVIAERVGRKG